MKRSGDRRFISFHTNPDDPPDCIAYDKDDRLIAIEVVELVDQFAVEQTERDNNLIRIWQAEDVIKKIGDILQTKDKKTYRSGNYHRIVIVIHVDEPLITYNAYSGRIKDQIFCGYSQVDEAYLLFSFDPSFSENPNDFPLIKLFVEKNE